MWLLDTKSYELEFFDDEKDVLYAILSHRWTDDEVLFEDLQHGRDPTVRKAWKKVVEASKQAQRDHLDYIWIDTCSINRTSSSELSEAINSMYRWYRSASECYVYLHDVPGWLGTDMQILNDCSEVVLKAWQDTVARSYEWFQRGWTLQELIAPQHLTFFDHDWKELGTRHSLARWVSAVSHVPMALLKDERELESFSIAQRFSWAANRETTRTEDVAYCLLGLFDVNMALLYGEGGDRAFIRLQEEIIRNSDDHSIFTWKLSDDWGYSGLLAQSPSDFAECGTIREIHTTRGKTSFQPSNMGLQITLPARHHGLNVYLAALDCEDFVNGSWVQIGIFIAVNQENERHARRMFEKKDRFLGWSNHKTHSFKKVFAVKNYPRRFFDSTVPWKEPLFGFYLDSCMMSCGMGESFSLSNGSLRIVARPGTWNPDEWSLRLEPGTMGTAMGFAIAISGMELQLFAKVGFDEYFRPWAWILNRNDIHDAAVQSGRPSYSNMEIRPAAATGGVFFDKMLSPDLVDVSSFDTQKTLSLLKDESVATGTICTGDIEVGINHPNVKISRVSGIEASALVWAVQLSFQVDLG